MSESPEARVERLKQGLPQVDQERIEELRRLVDVLPMGSAIVYNGMWQPRETAALLEKVSQALEVPLDIWVEEEESRGRVIGGDVIFCIPENLEIDGSFRLLINRGGFRVTDAATARAYRQLSPGERKRLEELESLVSKIEEYEHETRRGSYECKSDENPERVEELVRRLEPMVEERRLRTWIEGRVVWFEDISDETLGHGKIVAIDERYLLLRSPYQDRPDIQWRVAISYGPNVTKEMAGGVLAPPRQPGNHVFGLHHIGISGRRLAIFDAWRVSFDASDVSDEASVIARAKEILAGIDDDEYEDHVTTHGDEVVEFERSAFVGPWERVLNEEDL
jgi:hypothetical protein